MAYFERKDEAQAYIHCNICNSKNLMLESRHKIHIVECMRRHADKFANNILRVCEYDVGHIMESDKYDLHLEFCRKRQSELLGEFQRATKLEGAAQQVPFHDPYATLDHVGEGDVEDWGSSANEKDIFIMKGLRDLKLN